MTTAERSHKSHEPDPKQPTPPMTERDRMLGDYYARELRKRIELARIRSPGGLARLFPGLRKK